MSVSRRKLKSGYTWAYKFEAPGSTRESRRQLVGSGYNTKKEAQDGEAARRIEAQQQYEAELRGATKAVPRTMGDLLVAFIDDHAAGVCAPKTVERYRQQLPYLDPELMAMPANEVKALHLNREWTRLHDSGGHTRAGRRRSLSPKTVRNIAGLVSAAYRKGIHWGLVTINPVTNSEPPRGKRREAAVLVPDQVRLLAEAASAMASWLFMLLELCAATGMRRGEALALRWSDIRDGRVYITRSLCQTKDGLVYKGPKSGKTRVVGLPASAIGALARHWEEQQRHRAAAGEHYESGDLIICNPDGSALKPDSISSKVSLLARKLKLPKGVSLHTLRHSHGSHLLAAGTPLIDVAARLGHSTVQTTASVYAHALTGRDDEAAAAWEQFQQRSAKEARKTQ
jgi:integrase